MINFKYKKAWKLKIHKNMYLHAIFPKYEKYAK
jgi:hypothetical protein